jgi:hypothetical protein
MTRKLRLRPLAALWEILILCTLALVLTPSANAQVLYGSVVGTVEDQSGAAVPDARLALTNKQTGQKLETTSDAQGRYTFNNVPAGPYDLVAEGAGFKPLTQSGLNVVINSVLRSNVKLEIGSTSEQVTVSGSAAQLQTDTSAVQETLNTKAVTDLPLNAYRNYQALLNLVPGTTPALFQNSVGDTPARSLTTNVNGTARNNNNTRIDGAANVFVWLPHHALYVAPSETVETVSISTNAFDAEQGMAGGAAVAVVTKSGANDLHGVAFGYYDNQYLRSRNFFLPGNRDKPRNQTNIDGGTLGGAIIKNKLFYFGSFEGTWERVGSTGGSSFYTVATPDQRRGDFSAYNGTTIYDPLTGNSAGAGRTAFAGNVIPANRLDPIALKMQSIVPLPTGSGTANNFFNTGTQSMNRKNYDGKLNWNVNDRYMLWGKYSRMDADVNCAYVLNGAGGGGLCSGSPGIANTVVQIATVGNTWTVTPSFVVDGNFGYTRLDQPAVMPDYGANLGLDFLGIPGTNGSDVRQSGMPSFAIGGYTTLGDTAASSPSFRNDRSYTGTANASYLKGAHNIRFGVDIVRHSLNHWQPEIGYGPRGGFTFASGETGINNAGTGQAAYSPTQYNAYAAFLLGLPSANGKSLQNLLMTTREWQYGMYIRDRWQVNRNLTLNIGVRWELYPTLTRDGRGIEMWDPSTNLVTLGGIAGNPTDAGLGWSKKLFAPRVGFAYRLGEKTVIRSGYGIAYDPLPVSRPLRGPYPATISATNTAANSYSYIDTLTSGIPAIPTPDLSSGVIPLPINVDNRSPVAGTLKRGYIQSWNFIVEHEFPGKIVGSLGYIGTKTTNQFADQEINAAGPGTGAAGRALYSVPATAGRTASTWQWNGFLNSNYHALQASMNKSMGHGLMLKGAYTFSKAINMTDEDGWTTDLTFNYGPAFYRNRAVAGYDRTHALSFGWVYEFPFGNGKALLNGGGLASKIAGGWQLNGTLTAYSGAPFTVTADGTALNAPGNTQTANQTKSSVQYVGGIGSGHYFYDPTAFAAVNTAAFGNVGRNTLRGPGMFNSDLSVFRTFKIMERADLQFKAEAFNFTNTPKFANPAANVSTPSSFMQITSTRTDLLTERQFRFGLRLSF